MTTVKSTLEADPRNIVRIKNFLTSSQLKEFQEFFTYQDIFINKNCNKRSMVTVDYQYDIFNSTKKYLEKVYDAVGHHFGLDVVDFSGTCFRKWYPGEFQDPHSDCEANIYFEEENIKCDPFYNFSSLFLEYGALCYLNEDYTGGEIFFPQYSLSIKPEVNEFIFFPGTSKYIHGVKEVKTGNRLVVQNFLTTTKIMYLWKNFIQSKENINFVEYTQDEIMTSKRHFNRSNIPANCPHRIGE